MKFFGQDPSGTRFEFSTLSGDGASGIILGAGEQLTTWDAVADLGDAIDTDGYQIGIYAEDVTYQATHLKLDLDTYQMTPSVAGPSVAPGASSKYAELWFRRIEPGTFVMGSATSEPGRTAAREGAHTVTLTKAYYIGIFELTEGQFNKILGGTSTSALPVSNISYYDLRGSNYGNTWPTETDHRVDSDSLIGILRAKTGDQMLFDLPTEAQWEAAARWKGTTGNGTSDYYGSSVWNNGVTFNSSYYGLGVVAWCRENSGYEKHEVGLKAPSAIGTYDMHGNVMERCLDRYTENITSYVLDPVGALTGNNCIFRGGSYGGAPEGCRMAARRFSTFTNADVTIGCRLVIIP